MRRRGHARPENEREDKGKKEPWQAEDEEAYCRSVACDRRMGARLPDKGCSGDRGAGQSHRERRPEENSRGSKESQSAQESDKGREENEGGRETFDARGDPKIPHPSPQPEQQDVTSYKGRRGKLDAYVKSSPKSANFGERHEAVERREDRERV